MQEWSEDDSGAEPDKRRVAKRQRETSNEPERGRTCVFRCKLEDYADKYKGEAKIYVTLSQSCPGSQEFPVLWISKIVSFVQDKEYHKVAGSSEQKMEFQEDSKARARDCRI